MAGDLVPRCREYLWNQSADADITIRTELFHYEDWPRLEENSVVYMESGYSAMVGPSFSRP